jgi:hypothetical protein
MGEVECIAVDKKSEFISAGRDSKTDTFFKLLSVADATKFAILGTPRKSHGIDKHEESSGLGGIDACFKKFILDGMTEDVQRYM